MTVDDNVKKAYKFFQKYPGHLKTATDDIADRLDITYDEVAKGRRIYREDEKSDTDKKTVSNASEGVQERIEKAGEAQSYEEFLEHHGLDEDDVTNVWFKEKASGTYFSVEARKYKDAEPDFDPREVFRESIEEYTPEDYSDIFNKVSENRRRAGIINLFDAHLDKISSTRDTDEEHTIETNLAMFRRGFDEVLQSVASKNPEIIFFPVGNDFFHTNDFTLTTKRGTRQDDKVHETGMQAFRIGVNLLRECIDKIRSICPVKIIPVRGNHDEDRVRYLLECLLIAYENQQDVDIIDTHKPRIYTRYGSWLFGWAHGDKGIKLKEYPTHMSTDKEGKKHWSDINQGVYFIGHYHHEKKYEGVRKEDFKGVSVYMLRAASGTDSWHWEEGYTAIPSTAYGFVYDKNGEREQEFKANIN